MKRPGTLFPGRRALESAVAQARRYADEQKIRTIAATDGRYFYAADISPGGLSDRALIDLTSASPPSGLWALSVHGIYRPCTGAHPLDVPIALQEPAAVASGPEEALHPKYKLPAACFAYVPDASRPSTWKLPFRLLDGSVDAKRLPKAIQSLLTNFRGVKVAGIPEKDLAAVLRRLAEAAASEGRLPPQAIASAPVYAQLAQVLHQLGICL